MFTTSYVSHPPVTTTSRHQTLVAMAALIAVTLAALVLTFTVGHSGVSPQSRAANPLPQVRDMAPWWNGGPQTVGARTSGTRTDGPRTRAIRLGR